MNKNADNLMVFVCLRTDVTFIFCVVENAEERCSHITDRCIALQNYRKCVLIDYKRRLDRKFFFL